MISLIEVLELPNFGHMTTYQSCDKILQMTSWAEIMTSSPLFQNTFTLRRPAVAIFADIIKIVTMFSKKIS